MLATAGGAVAAVAASKATSSIPIVSVMGSDPVKLGLTNSLSRPDRNVTGAAQLLGDAEGKRVFISASSEGIGAVLVSADPFLFINVDHIVSLVARRSLPTVYFVREYVKAGGLISYGTRLGEALRQTGIYTGRILAGAQPADLPIVQQSEKIELIVNLRTARALGITVPTSLLLRADEVIE